MDDTKYGEAQGLIDPFFVVKKEWSKVKDNILKKYIDSYLKKIQQRGKPIIIIDAFSGPGKFGDGLEGSPLIVCGQVKGTPKRMVGISCLFADVKEAHRVELKKNLASYICEGICEEPLQDCPAALTKALQVGSGKTLFFYLDPYGIKDLEFEMVRQIYERNPQQSTEVLINFNFRAFMRMSGNWKYDATATEIAEKVKQAKTETVDAVMGGNYWLPIVTNAALSKIQREDAIVNAYMDQVRKFFTYVNAIPVKEQPESDGTTVPSDSLAKYHLIFGTRSPDAVIFMNDVALGELEPYLNKFKDGLLFEMTPERYKSADRDEVKKKIAELVAKGAIRRPDIYKAVIPLFFLDYMKKEYRAMIDEMSKAGQLFPDPKGIKKPGSLNDDVLLSTKPWNGASK